jgi:hypothetical protein
MSYYSRVQRLIERNDPLCQTPLLVQLTEQINKATEAIAISTRIDADFNDLYFRPEDSQSYIASLPDEIRVAADTITRTYRSNKIYSIYQFRTTLSKLWLWLYDLDSVGTTTRRQRPLLEAFIELRAAKTAIDILHTCGFNHAEEILSAFPEPRKPKKRVKDSSPNKLGNFPKKRSTKKEV